MPDRLASLVALVSVAAALFLGVCAAPPAGAEEPPAGAAPLPLAGNAVVKAATTRVYYVDGKQVIPAKAKIKVEPGVRIVGINGASLDVQGGLELQGNEGSWAVLENVDLTPTTAPTRGLSFQGASLKGVRIEHGEGQGLSGDVTFRHATLQRDCKLDLRLREGKLTFEIVDSTIPWILRSAPPGPKAKLPKIVVDRCWAKRTELEGPAEVSIRHSAFEGGLVFRHVTEVRLEGCDIGKVLSFHQGPEDSFRKVKLSKCNLFDGCPLVLHREAPAGAKVEHVKVKAFYFGPQEGSGAVTDDEGLARLVRDDAAFEEQAVVARISKPQENKHLFVDYGRLRCSVPPHD